MNPNLRILMTTDIKGEVWNHTITLYNMLSQLINAEIMLVSFGGKPTKPVLEQIEKYNFNIQITDYPSEWLNLNSDAFQYINDAKYYLKSLIDEFNPNIVHYNHCLYADSINIPSVITAHNDIPTRFRFGAGNNKNSTVPKFINNYRNITREAIAKTDVVITPSRFIGEKFYRNYDLNGKIKIIHNGISITPQTEPTETQGFLTEGNFQDRTKNLGLLFQIASKMPENIKIRIIGDKPLNKSLPTNIEYYENPSQEQLENIYKKSSIYLALSTYENFGYGAIKAALNNKAIVANDIPVYNEFWGDCGQIFERNNVNSLIRTINNLVENENLLQITARNCQTKALTLFNTKKMGFEYLNLYKAILQKNFATAKQI